MSSEQYKISFLRQRRYYKGIRGENPDSGWNLYGSYIESYEENFTGVLDGQPIKSLLDTKTFPIVLDLMAPSDTIADLFMQLNAGPKIGIAVSLEDKRFSDQAERDEALGITQIVGDLMDGSTWKKINNLLAGKKVDLILERAAGGLYELPFYEPLFASMLGKMWTMLTEDNGTMLIQVPPVDHLESSRVRFLEWIKLLKLNKINFTVDIPSNEYGLLANSYLKIVKTPNSPQELPQLPHH